MDRSEKRAGDMMMGRQAYAQQDAEECYAAIVNSLRNVPGLDGNGKSVGTGAEAAIGRPRFVQQFMMGEMRRELSCDEASEEPVTITTEQVLKVECNISINTNFMLSGIMSALDTKVEKNSPSLGRQAIYSQKSRLSRLPSYLTVHMVRFSWREDIAKKAKIMRKIKFPSEFDALDLATDELRTKLLPVSRKLKEIEKERSERRKVRKRTKQATVAAGPSSGPEPAAAAGGDVEMADVSAATAATGEVAAAGEEGKGKEVPSSPEFEDELSHRKKEAAELAQLIDEDVKRDIGCSATGLYELVAIVTHKGAAADAGHYIGFVKKSVFHAYKNKNKEPDAARGSASRIEDAIANLEPPTPLEGEPKMTTAELDQVEDDDDWYKFDDEKVSLFPKEKLATLDGGGEDSSAYVLLYKSKSIL
jgi:ubiquitin carboxyl-terminal hydrolase 14